MRNCPDCNAFATGEEPECPGCGRSFAGFSPVPVMVEPRFERALTEFLRVAPSAKELAAPPLLYPREQLLQQTVQTNQSVGFLAGMMMNSYVKLLPPRMFVTDRRLLVWNPVKVQVKPRSMATAELVGFQVARLETGLTTVRAFRKLAEGAITIGSVIQDLQKDPARVGRVNMNAMIGVTMLGPGPLPSDQRYLDADAAFWLTRVTSPDAASLGACLHALVPSAWFEL